MKANKILIVDDQPENLSVLVDIFERSLENFEVFQSLSGDNAFSIASAEVPDLIITDWEMPDMDGIELIKILKNDPVTKHIPIIMCTGIMTNPENLQTALEAGAVDYVRKPVDNVELIARVRSMLELVDSYNTIRQQKERVEELLLNILPEGIVERLKKDSEAITTDYFEEASIMFTDFVKFTQISEKMPPEELVTELSIYFEAFDLIIEKHGLEKIKTIGDAYMCAAGIPTPFKNHAEQTVKAGLDILEFVEKRNKIRREKDLPEWQVRIGIHTGNVIAGVVGKKKFAYDVWGDTVNIASRIEASGEPGKLNISAGTYQLIKDLFKCSYRGKIGAKNMVDTDMYFVNNPIN